VSQFTRPYSDTPMLDTDRLMQIGIAN